MHINLEYYKIFYYVAKNKQFTTAAKELSLSQPAISQAVKNLEQQLGTRLFTRMAKGVRLTPEGQVLYNYIQKGYETILQGEYKVMQMLNLESGEVRIGASDMTLQFYLLPYLEQFHQQFPQIKVRVTNGPTPETIEALQSGQIDFGIVSTPLDLPTNLRSYEVRDIEDIFVAGTAFSHLKGKTLPYEQANHLPFISLEQNTSTRRNLDVMLAQEGISIQPEFELSTSDMIVQFAVRNLGIGYVMSEFAKEFITQGLLFPVSFPDPPPRRQFCIVIDQHIHLSTAATRLLEILDPSQFS